LSIRMDIGASGYTFMSRIGPLLQHQCCEDRRDAYKP
jgi:hypothetical protein